MVKFIDCVTGGQYPELKPLSAFDSYFSFSGREYRVINPTGKEGSSSYEVELVRSHPKIGFIILKVASLMTGIIPLIMLIGKLICRSLHDFSLKDSAKPKSQVDLSTLSEAKIKTAKELIQKFNVGTVTQILELGITDQTALADLLKVCAKKDAWATSGNIHKFGIVDEQALFEIAQICLKKSVGDTLPHFANFGFKDPKHLLKLAWLSAKEDGFLTADCIKEFNIKEEAERIMIAKFCAKTSPVSTALYIAQFEIQDQAALIEIAKICAQGNGKETSKWIKNFGIEDQARLVEIAECCALENGQGTLKFLANFGIEDEEMLKEIVMFCGESAAWDKRKKAFRSIHKPRRARRARSLFSLRDDSLSLSKVFPEAKNFWKTRSPG